MTPRPCKIELPLKRGLDLGNKNNVFDPKMVLRAFWSSLGLLLDVLESDRNLGRGRPVDFYRQQTLVHISKSSFSEERPGFDVLEQH